MMLLGEQPVSGANLGKCAIAVEAERGVMIDFSALQFPSLPKGSRIASFIARTPAMTQLQNKKY